MAGRASTQSIPPTAFELSLSDQPARSSSSIWPATGRIVSHGSRAEWRRIALALATTLAESSLVGVDSEARSEAAAGCCSRAQRREQADVCLLVEVDQEAFADEQRRRCHVVAGGCERGGAVVAAEVGGQQDDAVEVGSQACEAASLVGLGCGLVDLEIADAGGAEAQRSIVVAGAEDHHLRDAGVECGKHLLVEEARALDQVGAQLRAARRAHAAGDLALGLAVTARRPRPLERCAERGDSLARARRSRTPPARLPPAHAAEAGSRAAAVGI